MVPAYLLSHLRAQLAAAENTFAERYPQHWLVWEPGTWTAPAAARETVQVNPRSSTTSPGRGDALSFGLKPNPGHPETLTIGRSHTNDISINDATVSRQHAVLKVRASGSWSVEIGPGVKAHTRVGDRDLVPGEAAILRPGDPVRLGDVRLTYYDLPGLIQRLRG